MHFHNISSISHDLFLLCRDKSGDRDVFNERPTRDEQSVAAASTGQARSGPSPLANSATIHTTLGDIHMRLFPQQAPKAVENFVGHARSGYFEGVIFHRVIPKFMIQTGDPLGDGTGGMSIWGKEFEDEFSDDLKHDRCVSSTVFLAFVLTCHQTVYCQHGKCRSSNQWISIFYHNKCDPLAGQEAYDLRSCAVWP